MLFLFLNISTGASHTVAYSIFHDGGMASPAVSELCRTGNLRSLEQEFRNAGDKLLTVIRTRGISSAAPPERR
ncbi:unnamed protein product [Protopolystoma xenopodis]|uniref:Spondin domain-containing protein n=1 Tax=Protopolystoma xenopodis TaxID=117903 RepID=A0A3S4ZDX9_9PLAT|nr:unnamed protein product [Protopolystoma xenopodis]